MSQFLPAARPLASRAIVLSPVPRIALRNLSTSLRSHPSEATRPLRYTHVFQTQLRSLASTASPSPPVTESLETPLPDAPAAVPNGEHVDWSRSFSGLSTTPFPSDVASVLLAPIDPVDVEIKPDGLCYLPEIKYRRILNRAFGPGGWGLAPRGEVNDTGKMVSREYGLVVHGRLVSIARGEKTYFDPDGVPTALEGAKSNALMRCCKDLGIASELWDPVYLRKFLADNSKEVWVEHTVTKKKKKIVMRKDVAKIPYPFKETKP